MLSLDRVINMSPKYIVVSTEVQLGNCWRPKVPSCPVYNAYFVTFRAELGRLCAPETTFDFFLELQFLEQNRLKVDFWIYFSGVKNRPISAPKV